MHVNRIGGNRPRWGNKDSQHTAPAITIPNTQEWRPGRVYAIAFDLDTDVLKRRLGESAYTSAWHSVRRVFEERGFAWRQGSLYFGNERTTPVDCVLAVQEASKRFTWFRDAVTDIRMLRIEENNDLYPALGEPELPFGMALPLTSAAQLTSDYT